MDVLSYLVQFGQLCILIFDWRSRAIVQGNRNEERRDIEFQQLRLLLGAKVGVESEQVEILGQVSAVLRHLNPEQSQRGKQEVVRETRPRRQLQSRHSVIVEMVIIKKDLTSIGMLDKQDGVGLGGSDNAKCAVNTNNLATACRTWNKENILNVV